MLLSSKVSQLDFEIVDADSDTTLCWLFNLQHDGSIGNFDIELRWLRILSEFVISIDCPLDGFL